MNNKLDNIRARHNSRVLVDQEPCDCGMPWCETSMYMDIARLLAALDAIAVLVNGVCEGDFVEGTPLHRIHALATGAKP